MKLDDLDNFISGMKVREAEQRALSDEHRLKAEVIQAERMKFEHYRYKVAERDKASSVPSGNEEQPVALGKQDSGLR